MDVFLWVSEKGAVVKFLVSYVKSDREKALEWQAGLVSEELKHCYVDTGDHDHDRTGHPISPLLVEMTLKKSGIEVAAIKSELIAAKGQLGDSYFDLIVSKLH